MNGAKIGPLGSGGDDLLLRYRGLLKAGGTHQRQRTLPALERHHVVPDERDLGELLAYTRRLAAELRFFNPSGQATGTWRGFLDPLMVDPAGDEPLAGRELAATLAGRRDWPPHLALLLAFLRLYRFLQDDFAELPEKHLRHYLEQVLGLRRRPPRPDRAHVVFTPARNAAPELVPAGTLIEAGTDAAGNPLTYATTADLVVNHARLGEVRRMVAERDLRGQRRFFVSSGVGDAEAEAWRPFGERQLALEPARRTMTEAALGFAVASPMLRLAEGERHVLLRAHLRGLGGLPPRPQGVGYALVPQLTGAEGWLTPDVFTARLLGAGETAEMLEIDLTLEPGSDAVVPFDPALHPGVPGLAAGEPMLRCLVRGETGVHATLDGLVVDRLEVHLTVNGVRDLALHGDQGALDPAQPAPLLGSQPRLGSRFYVGSAEAFGKRPTSLAVHLDWLDLPPDLFAHYAAYFDGGDADLQDAFHNHFQVDVDLMAGGLWRGLLVRQSLFTGSPEPRRVRVFTSDLVDALGEDPGGSHPVRDGFAPLPAPGTADGGWLRFTLRSPRQEDLVNGFGQPHAERVPFNAFGHAAFPRRYALQAVALAQAPPGGTPPELPNAPYTPTLADLSLDYTASADVVVGDLHATTRFHTLEPWGHLPAAAEVPARLVPELDDAFQGALFLPVEELRPPATLSFLVQVDRGTATTEEALEAGDVEWSYLAGERWTTVPPAALLQDTTRGFQQPGLVALTVGADASREHSRMPAGTVWLRARVDRPPGSAARVRSLHPQAAETVLAPAGGELAPYGDHLEAGLPAGRLNRLARRRPAIRAVEQPYPSSGGRAGEDDRAFFQRSSERLRHRRRAVTEWDLEHLVLEAFPEVFKVRALPHTGADGRPRAGEVTLVIVPDLTLGGGEPLRPRADAVLMGRIRDFLRSDLATPFARLDAVHPVFERILVDAQVAFHAGADPGYHALLLGDELQRFLSPWAFEEGRDIVFGGRIYRSDVLSFIEERPYVDFVTDFHLYHSYDGPPREGIGFMTLGLDFVISPDSRPAVATMEIGDDFVVGRGVEVAATGDPRAILVSHPTHRIRPIDAGQAACPGADLLGIGYMTIGLDFDVIPDFGAF